MGPRGPRLLRLTTNHVLDALLQAAETAYHGQPIGMKALHDIVEGLKAGAHFDEFYRHSYAELTAAVEQEKLAQQRSNAYGRLMIHPLNPALQDGTLDRDMLPNVFSFFHLVLGDDAQTYGDRCKDIVSALRDDLGDQFHWDRFYADPAAKRVQWHTLTRIATSFKRWELRKEWFIKLMQYTPTTVSLGQSAFVTREVDHTEEPRVFSNRDFCAFFQALFTPLTDMPPSDEPLFRKEFGSDPHHLIGHFLVHLASCEM
jgi:hypothetical protein